MDNIIVLKKSDLEELLSGMIPEKQVETKEVQKEYLSFDEGLQYINDKGFKISKSHLYKKTMNKEIGFKRFGGRKIIFEPDVLDGWIESQLTDKTDNVSESVVRSAKRKEL